MTKSITHLVRGLEHFERRLEDAPSQSPTVERLFGFGDEPLRPLTEWTTEELDRALDLLELGEAEAVHTRGRGRTIEVRLRLVQRLLPGPRGLLPSPER